MKKFPKVIYVERWYEGTDDEFLSVHEQYQDAAEADEKVTVGVYELKSVKVVTAKSELMEK